MSRNKIDETDIVEQSSPQALTNEHEVRMAKVEAMRAEGIEPWAQAEPVNATAQDALEEFTTGTHEGREYHLAGRLMSMRHHGKTSFAHLQDSSGQIQLYIRKDTLGEQAYDQWNRFIDIGDIIWCVGTTFETKTGETTVQVTRFKILAKCLYPLAEKFHGLTDVEQRYRQRYLDLICNPDSKKRFEKRSEITKIMRNYFDSFGYQEVETPMLHPIAGGAAARPFVTHHNALDIDLYLRIAPELYLKRLVVGGFQRVYEINRNFRNEGISTRHNPEFTMVEFYTANERLSYAMEFVEGLFRRIAQRVVGELKVPYAKGVVDFEAPFTCMSVKQAVMHHLPCSALDLEVNTIDSTTQRFGINGLGSQASVGQKIYHLFEKLVEHKLIQPTFITEFPIEVSPLAKRNPENPSYADRFELFVAGMELSNGFEELSDPFDQADRLKQQVAARTAGDEEAHEYDADYIQALEYGLPPTVGVGIGIDRLVMIMTDTQSIKDVILFPTLRPIGSTVK